MATSISSFGCGRSLTVALLESAAFGSAGANFSFQPPGAFAHGTGAGKVNKVYAARATIPASSNLDLDLAGSLTDLLKNPAVFTRLKFVFFEVITAPLGVPVTFGATVANAVFAWAVPVAGGSDFVWGDYAGDGRPVVGGSADVLRVANNDPVSAAVCNICLAGEG